MEKFANLRMKGTRNHGLAWMLIFMYEQWLKVFPLGQESTG
jgi:hypothetical protein